MTIVSKSNPQDLATALHEAESRYSAANPESARMAQLASSWMPGGNTRTTLHFAPFPLTIKSANGSIVTDVDGHDYADLVNEYSAGLFGHSSPVILDAINKAAARGLNLSGPNTYESELAHHIVDRFPSIELLRFCNSGTEANLLALGTARAVTGKKKVMAFNGSYHGSLFQFLPNPSPINAPFDVVLSTYNDWTRTESLLDEHGADLAAVLVEPMQGAIGCFPGDVEFLENIRKACTERGIIMIFDEVMTSRLSTGGQQSRVGIVPDMTTIGKYIGGGLTLSAFGGRRDIISQFDPRRANALPHGGTFNNIALAMAAGLAAFEELLTADALYRMNSLGDALRERINDASRNIDLPLSATGIGSLLGLHFNPTPVRDGRDLVNAPAARKLHSDLTRLLHYDLIEAGYYAARRGYLALSLETKAEETTGVAQVIERFLSDRKGTIRKAYAEISD